MFSRMLIDLLVRGRKSLSCTGSAVNEFNLASRDLTCDSCRAPSILDSLIAALSDRIAIFGRAHQAALPGLRAGADAGESACQADLWVALRRRSQQPAPGYRAGFRRHDQRNSMVWSTVASRSAPDLSLQPDHSEHRADGSIVQAPCGAVQQSRWPSSSDSFDNRRSTRLALCLASPLAGVNEEPAEAIRYEARKRQGGGL
jgi:hypothetical protein